MTTIGRYTQLTDLTNRDAGTSRHCEAEYRGKKYFLKEFSAPKYPVDDSLYSPAMAAKKKQECAAFEQEKRRMYDCINQHSCGIAVRIEELFRVGACYYAAMEFVEGKPIPVEEVAGSGMQLKRRLCATLAHAVAGLHEGGFVHGDIKHSNVMFTTASSGVITAKLIDYDAGFMADSPPDDPELFEGDLLYYAPESCCFLVGQEVRLTEKIDIFALGVLFHQYLTGDLPAYDTEEYTCAGDAIAARGEVTVSDELPEDLRNMLERMLSPNPHERPAAYEVFCILRGIPYIRKEKEEDEAEPADDEEFEKDPLGQTGWRQNIPDWR